MGVLAVWLFGFVEDREPCTPDVLELAEAGLGETALPCLPHTAVQGEFPPLP